MYKIKVPAICIKNIKVTANNREEALKKACFLIENNKIDDINWRFTKDIYEAINFHSLIPTHMYINEGDLSRDGKVYLISIPCTGYAVLDVDSSNAIDAINKALIYLRFNKVNIFNIKAHKEISFDDKSILKKYEYTIE